MTKSLTYAIKLTYDPEYKGWVADCLNLYGCMSQGKTKKEALKNIEKAIKAYMRALAEETDKEEIHTKRVKVAVAV